jgi:tripartite-type tricarboxylate transporter receptor subunit TctC
MEPPGRREAPPDDRFLAIAIVLGTAATALAQSCPSRPITMIVQFPAGGATDVLARIIAEPMRASLGQHTGWSIAVVSSD